jgi:aldehyde dehydrogenase (NAD+)
MNTLARRFDQLSLDTRRLFIDGAWRAASSDQTWRHVNPASLEQLTTFPVATADDVALAVAAARRAFDAGPWRRMRARERKAHLQRLARAIADHAELLNQCQTLDNAMPFARSSTYRFSGTYAADVVDYYAGIVADLGGRTYAPFAADDAMQFFSVHEPVGVVASISAWNSPILQVVNKVAPALAAGCTVVLKPSEYASLTAFAFAHIAAAADLPPGVFNLVTGPGETTGEALVTDERIDKIAFTGSRRIGARMLEAAARTIKRVTLELGGKSPGLVFDDCRDVAAAAREIAARVFHGMSGQTCSAQTRVLVQRPVYEAFVEAAAQEATRIRYGDPFDPATTGSPIVNERQLQRIAGFLERADAAGVQARVSGSRSVASGLPQPWNRGLWFTPTLLVDVDPRSEVAREEVFGPVLAVTPFDTEEQALALANDSAYGLSAGVYTADVQRALRVADALRAGTVGINGYSAMPNSPFGGYKASGLGREGGREGLQAYLETKTVMVRL